MGKPGSTSWFTAVKKVFRSPSKSSPKKECETREVCEPGDEEEEKKTEKRSWIFRKVSSHNQQYEANIMTSNEKNKNCYAVDEHRYAPAAVEASTVAEKAVIAGVEVGFRVEERIPAYLAREYYAALIIQTAFRAYLARRALSALKGIVKLQAIVRGHNIRKQAKTTLKCMQTLIRVQAKLRDHSFSSQNRKSMYAESNNLWDKYKQIRQRKQMFVEESEVEDRCKNYKYTIDDIDAILQSNKEASLYREHALAYALTQQIRRFDRKTSSEDENKDAEWLSQWLEAKEYSELNNSNRLTNRTEPIKDVDMESLQSNFRTPTKFHAPNRRHSLYESSPGFNKLHSMTPMLQDTRSHLQAQSASPRTKGYRSHSAANTPNLRMSCPSSVSSYRYSRTSSTTTTPNYMAATESAKAKARTQSTPRQRHSTSSDRSDRVGSVKKRLSFPIREPQLYSGNVVYNDYSCFSQNLRSPSFRSVQEGLYCLERGTTCSSTYTEITGGEVSPASTSHLRRWLS
ncbi:protein IQ-DOMAIN 17-like [Amaranthus tricolor]|uniref:protein IQ-DOMAIN 17-like n=1 Tax=Amaranthus tricolor TaxID=29722 RepID=UPI002583C2A2|nr:protein IQ-DOMAIN 17-like [Amaranthus tricolor]